MFTDDEKDYIMRMIKEIARVLASVMLGKKYVQEDLAEAMFFYEYAASKGDEFLEAHNYSLEEIRDGIQQLAEDAGYGNIINMLDIR